MGVLSKLFVDVLGWKVQTANCYEMLHTWNPSCCGAVKDVMGDACWFSFKTYATVYLLAALVSKRDVRRIDWLSTLQDICRSTAFLSTNLTVHMILLCFFRHLLGFSVLPTMGLVNGILASWLAILVESPKRRPLLSLYVTNLASETAYRQLVNHGYLKLLPHGQVLVFAIGLAGCMCLLKRKLLSRNLTGVLNFALRLDDKDEEFIRTRPSQSATISRWYRLVEYIRVLTGKHPLCTHTHSCVSRSVESLLRNATCGLGLSSALVLARNVSNILRRPAKVARELLSMKNFSLALFLGGMPLLYHTSECMLNRLFNLDTPATQVISAALSSLAMLVYPSVWIAMYLLWKFIEACHSAALDKGYVPKVPNGDILLYALSTGYILWTTTMEPQAIRKGYWVFLSKLTGGRVDLVNRHLCDVFGYKSSLLFGQFCPRLDPKRVTIDPASYLPQKQ